MSRIGDEPELPFWPDGQRVEPLPPEKRADGSFELVSMPEGGEAIYRRPVLTHVNGKPHVSAGYAVCRFSPDAPEGFPERILDMLNDAHAWGQI